MLGSADLKLGANFVSDANELNVTMSQTGTAITVTLGSHVGGRPATAGAGTITWWPSSAATDLMAKPSGTALVTEPGVSDVDL